MNIRTTMAACALAALAMPLAGLAARPGTDATPIAPTALDTLEGCAAVAALGLNGGEPRQVAGQAYWCYDWQARPVLWSEGTGMVDLPTIGSTTGGSAEAVSDDGTSVGWLIGGGAGLAFARPLGGAMEELPMLSGMTYASAQDVSPNGQYIVGWNSSESDFRPVRWDRSSGNWEPVEVPLEGASAVSNEGAVVGTVAVEGSTERRAAIWQDDAVTELPGTETRANGIDATATIVVGYRLEPVDCRRPPCADYEIPMVWVYSSGQWNAHELIALDGVDSEATAAAIVGGVPVVVGYGYSKRRAVMRAVAWKADTEGTFDVPIVLGGLDGNDRAWASAADVNSSGQVVGTSGMPNASPRRPGSIRAVLWQLP